MSISAKDTTKSLRKTVYPLLKKLGFDDWTTRSAWRRNGDRIENIEFRSFSAYYAQSFNCTSASISVWIGIKPVSLSIDPYTRRGPKGLRPSEAAMPIRASVAPSLDLKQRNKLLIWNIDSHDDLDISTTDIVKQLDDYGIDWINRTYDPKFLLQLLQDDQYPTEIDSRQNGAQLWIDAGTVDSPKRNRRIAEVAQYLGEYALAAEHFERARWAFDHSSGERYLFLSPDEDAELLKLAQNCADRV